MDLFMDWKPYDEKREQTWATLAKMEKWVACRKAAAWAPQIVGLSVYYLLAAVLPYYLLLGLLEPKWFKEIGDLSVLIAPFPFTEELWALELPWWGVLVAGFVGLFAVPMVLALVTKLLAVVLSHLLVREKRTPLPTDVIQREKSIHQRASNVLKKYERTRPPLDGVWMSYVSVGLMVIIPFALAIGTSAIDTASAGLEEPWLVYLMVIGEGLVAMAIPGFLCWMLFLWLSTLLNKMLDPLCEDKLYYKRKDNLIKYLPILYKRWTDVDAVERMENEKRAKAIEEMNRKEAAFKEEFRQTMAGVYLREQKERQAYMEDLRRWARGDYDDPSDWRGKGDGI